MVAFLQWILFIFLALVFSVVCNLNTIAISTVFHRKSSLIKFFINYVLKPQVWFIGGIAGMIACLVSPLEIAHLWYIPLLLDPGCGLFLFAAIVSFTTASIVGFGKGARESLEAARKINKSEQMKVADAEKTSQD